MTSIDYIQPTTVTSSALINNKPAPRKANDTLHTDDKNEDNEYTPVSMDDIFPNTYN